MKDQRSIIRSRNSNKDGALTSLTHFIGRHASTLEGAIEYRKQYRAFLDQYYYASGLWMEGVVDAPFPVGSFKAPLIRVAV